MNIKLNIDFESEGQILCYFTINGARNGGIILTRPELDKITKILEFGMKVLGQENTKTVGVIEAHYLDSLSTLTSEMKC